MQASSRPRVRQQLLQHANKDQINALSEVVLNSLRNNVPVDQPLMARLRRYKKPLRELGNRKPSILKRKNVLLQQKGKGFCLGVRDLCHCIHGGSAHHSQKGSAQRR